MSDLCNYLGGTTAIGGMPMDVLLNFSAAPEKRLFCGHGNVMPDGSGGDSRMPADNQASTARCSATKASTKQASLCDRLTPLLMSSGLIYGIIPMSMRDASGQLTLDAVLRPLDGVIADERKAD